MSTSPLAAATRSASSATPDLAHLRDIALRRRRHASSHDRWLWPTLRTPVGPVLEDLAEHGWQPAHLLPALKNAASLVPANRSRSADKSRSTKVRMICTCQTLLSSSDGTADPPGVVPALVAFGPMGVACVRVG